LDAVLFPIDIVHREARVEDAELRAHDTGNLCGIWVELWRARCNRHHHMDQKIARWNVGGIKRADNRDAVLRIIRIKAELFVEFADRRLLRCLAGLHLSAREGELPAVRSTLRALDEEHLTVERVHLNTFASTVHAAGSERHWRHQECGNSGNAGRPFNGRIQVNRLKAGESSWGEVRL